MSKVKVPIPNGTLYSASMTFDQLTSKLYEEKPLVFEYNKICGWLELIQQESMYPYIWNNPTRSGLRAKCKPLESKEQYQNKLEELKIYVNKINEEYNTDIKIEKEIK
jgi:hypothetical protein